MNTLTFALEHGDLPAHLGVVGYEGDAGCATLEFTGALPGMTYVLDLEHQQTGAKNVLALENHNGTLSVALDGSVQIPAGRYDVQLRTVGDVVTHSAKGEVIFRDAINAVDSFATMPTELRQMEQRILTACAAGRIFSGTCADGTANRTVVLSENSRTAFDGLQDGDLFVVKFDKYPTGGISLKIGSDTAHPLYFRWANANSYGPIPKGAWQNGAVRSFRFDAEGNCFLLCDFGTAYTSSTAAYYGTVRLSDRTDLNDSSFAATAKAVKSVQDYVDALEKRVCALEPPMTVNIINEAYDAVEAVIHPAAGTTWREFVESDTGETWRGNDDCQKTWQICNGRVTMFECRENIYGYEVYEDGGRDVDPDDVIRADGNYYVWADD